jgi:hypothetical protein
VGPGSKFGEGMVMLQIESEGSRERAQINFRQAEVKWLWPARLIGNSVNLCRLVLKLTRFNRPLPAKTRQLKRENKRLVIFIKLPVETTQITRRRG